MSIEESEKITGTVEYFMYQTETFAIASFLPENQFIAITLKGALFNIEEKEKITVYGKWTEHEKYGKQFLVTRWEKPMPESEEQIIKYLVSPVIKGCGEKRAKQMVEEYGVDTLKIIMEKGTDALLKIKGLGKKGAQRVVDSVLSQFYIQNIMLELLPYDLTPSLIMRIYKEFGVETLQVIHENPYKLTSVYLIGFDTADKIAVNVGIEPDSPYRKEACLSHILQEETNGKGHCYVPKEELIQLAIQRLTKNQPALSLTPEDLQDTMNTLLTQEDIWTEGNKVYPKWIATCEMELGSMLANRILHRQDTRINAEMINKLIIQYENEERIPFAAAQKEAVTMLLKESTLVLTGGPGTGKTTVVKAMVDIFRQLQPEAKIALAAPTGRASRQLADVVEMDESFTVHSLIGYRQGEIPEFNEDNPLPYDLLVIDESSMLDLPLARLLFKAIGLNTKVALVGDQDQLPSVGVGNVLKDILNCKQIPRVQLTEVFRQAKESQIVTNAHAINKGEKIRIDPSKEDFYFIPRYAPERIAATIKESILRFFELGYTSKDILLLTPMKKGPIGTIALNNILQETINPKNDEKNEIIKNGVLFREGDKIIQLKNNREKGVFNGDIGVINLIERFKIEGETKTVVTCTINDREVHYKEDDLGQLQLAYAITIHKSQGGQAPIVIIPVSMSHYRMLARNLLYTGVTRAKVIVVLIGTEEAIWRCILNNQISQRYTKLTDRIETFLEKQSV